MVNKAKTRKRQRLETEFLVGGKPWTMERIERSAKRAKLEGAVQAEIIGVYQILTDQFVLTFP
jgi:hypothetical protein